MSRTLLMRLCRSLTAVCFCTKEKWQLATKRKKSSPMLYCPKFCKSLSIFLIPTANILCIPHSPQPCLIGMKNSANAEKLLFFVTGLMLFGDISRLKSENFFSPKPISYYTAAESFFRSAAFLL